MRIDEVHEKLVSVLIISVMLFVFIGISSFSIMGISVGIKNISAYWFHYDAVKDCYVIEDECVDKKLPPAKTNKNLKFF